MKPELEVARDAVRTALGDDVADALEWAAAAVEHRATLLSAARWSATEGGACVDCGRAYMHDATCPTAAMLHELDPEWSRQQVDRAHHDAPNRAPRRLRPMHELGGNLIPPRPPFESRPARLEWTAPIVPSQLVTFDPPRAHPDGDVLMGMALVVASPQPAQPQSEDDTSDERGEWDPDGWQE